jgi:formate-dependent nitrite reductase cytochrome c552 subunit
MSQSTKQLMNKHKNETEKKAKLQAQFIDANNLYRDLKKIKNDQLESMAKGVNKDLAKAKSAKNKLKEQLSESRKTLRSIRHMIDESERCTSEKGKVTA